MGMIRWVGHSFGVVTSSFLLERHALFNLSVMTPSQGAYLSEGTRNRVVSHLQRLLLQTGAPYASLQSNVRSFLSYILLNEAVTRAYQGLFLFIAAVYLLLLATSALFLPKARKNPLPQQNS